MCSSTAPGQIPQSSPLPPSPSTLARPIASSSLIDPELFRSLLVIWGRHTDPEGESIKRDLCSPIGQGVHAKAFYFLLNQYREETRRFSQSDSSNSIALSINALGNKHFGTDSMNFNLGWELKADTLGAGFLRSRPAEVEQEMCSRVNLTSVSHAQVQTRQHQHLQPGSAGASAQAKAQPLLPAHEIRQRIDEKVSARDCGPSTSSGARSPTAQHGCGAGQSSPAYGYGNPVPVCRPLPARGAAAVARRSVDGAVRTPIRTASPAPVTPAVTSYTHANARMSMANANHTTPTRPVTRRGATTPETDRLKDALRTRNMDMPVLQEQEQEQSPQLPMKRASSVKVTTTMPSKRLRARKSESDTQAHARQQEESTAMCVDEPASPQQPQPIDVPMNVATPAPSPRRSQPHNVSQNAIGRAAGMELRDKLAMEDITERVNEVIIASPAQTPAPVTRRPSLGQQPRNHPPLFSSNGTAVPLPATIIPVPSPAAVATAKAPLRRKNTADARNTPAKTGTQTNIPKSTRANANATTTPRSSKSDEENKENSSSRYEEEWSYVRVEGRSPLSSSPMSPFIVSRAPSHKESKAKKEKTLKHRRKYPSIIV